MALVRAGKERSFWLEIGRPPSATDCDNLIALPFQMANSLAAPQLNGNLEAVSFLTPFLPMGPNRTVWAVTVCSQIIEVLCLIPFVFYATRLLRNIP